MGPKYNLITGNLIMKIERISVKSLVITVLLLLGLVSIALSIFSAYNFQEAALASQGKTLSRSIEVAARESMKQLNEIGTDL